MNKRYTPRQQAEMARMCHQLRKGGMSLTSIAKEMGITRDTVTRYLERPCPTEEQIAAAPDEHPAGGRTDGGLVNVRVYLPVKVMERLKATSVHDNPTISALAREAIEFWCNAIERINSDDHSPVRMCGAKVRFERKA
jgi:lambda repressor-like predicted transcriptional regulator